MTLGEAWETEAARWIKWARQPGHDSYWRFHRDQFLTLLPPPGALTVDIGCGEGRLSRDLKRLEHRVIAVDVSRTLVAAARDADPGGEYLIADAAALPLSAQCCDLVVAFMCLQDFDALDTAVAEIGRILVDGGRACVAIEHPLNSAGRFADESRTSPFVIEDTYLGEVDHSVSHMRNGLEMTFHSRHRPVEAYSHALEGARFVIEAIREPPVPDAAARSERSQRWQRVPLFLHLRVVKLRPTAR